MIKPLMLSTVILGAALVPAAANEIDRLVAGGTQLPTTNEIMMQNQLSSIQTRLMFADDGASGCSNCYAPPPGRWVRVWVGTPNNPSPNVYYTGDLPGCRTNAARPDWGCY
jgi:hypothetical protein